MDSKQLKEQLLQRIEELAPYLFPNGKRDGRHWVVADISGAPGKSFKICVTGEKAGLWGDFADSRKHSRSLLDLWMEARNVDFRTALQEARQWTGQSLNGSEPQKQKPLQRANQKNPQQFNWQECVAALKMKDLVRLGNQRWWSRAFCQWLRDEKKIGLYKGHFAFPVERDGKILAAKYKWGPTSNDWSAYPTEQGAACFILGDPQKAKNIHLGESQWDMCSLADQTDWFRDADNHAFIASPGSGNAHLVKGLIPPPASLLAWPQNDKPGEKWLHDLARYADAPMAKAIVPAPHKDIGEWCKAGASPEAIYNARWRNELVEVPKPRASTLDQLLTETVAVLKEHITFASKHQPVVIACWIAHVHCIEHFYCTGYLSISSPIKRCGKSNLLKCISWLTPRGWYAISPSVCGVVSQDRTRLSNALSGRSRPFFCRWKERQPGSVGNFKFWLQARGDR
jgi:hypothetical protein